MPRRKGQKKNRKSSNANNNRSSSNSEGTMSLPTPNVTGLPQENPPQELPPQELPPQELPAQELPPIENNPTPKYIYGETYEVYLPIGNGGPSQSLEELRAHPYMEVLQRAMKEGEFLTLEFTEQ
ncbi:uncharacterized protein LOC100573022 [Acyrthosiphon pisum]|uniref:Uncharacterized protein n=1 Tax=Acyrthosiphon pisum TaxID=7029 RepID=A0A8R1WBU1_ACYPI|nr:uncharacterized protein LOC100573022 [Acyrthosiphon pisum]|eukprot:XP_003246822.1 PREDICTED: uncharacterized protein LOC100573022 [Acyrthosiphon pisum]